MHKTALRRPVFVLSGLLCLPVCFLAGCGEKSGSSLKAGNVTTPAAVLVFIDRSESISGYTHGGGKGIRTDYKKIAQSSLKPVLTGQKFTFVEVRPFVDADTKAFGRKFDLWENLKPKLEAQIDLPNFRTDEASNTLFSGMLDRVGAFCDEHAKDRVVILVLSDCHPDDSFGVVHNTKLKPPEKPSQLDDCFALIQEAATRLSQNAHKPYLIGIGSAEPDIKCRWAERLKVAMSPLGDSVVIVNHDDYAELADRAKTLIGGDNQ